MTAAPLLLDLTLALEHLLCLLQLCLHTQSTHARHDVETEGTLTVRSSVLFIESIFVISFSCSSFRSIDISASCRANSLSRPPHRCAAPLLHSESVSRTIFHRSWKMPVDHACESGKYIRQATPTTPAVWKPRGAELVSRSMCRIPSPLPQVDQLSC